MTVNLDSSLKTNIIKALDKVENVLKITLGPLGRNVLLQRIGEEAIAINDGASIINELSFEDKLTDLICKLLIEVANNTNEEVGDGTTSSVVLTSNITKNLLKIVQSDTNVYEVNKGVKLAYKDIERQLLKKAVPVLDVKKVAMLSTGANEELSDLISQAFNESKGIPAITIEQSRSTESEVKIVCGMELETGYSTPYMCNNPDLEITELDNCFVLLVDGAITTINEIVAFMEYCATQSRKGLIIAEDMSSEPLSVLIQNFQRGVTDVHFIKAPGVGQTKRDILDDLASMTGAVVVDKKIEKLEESELRLGILNTVRISKKTSILTAANDEQLKHTIRARVHSLEKELENCDFEYLKNSLMNRIAKLTGSIVKIQVGAYTDTELMDKKLRLEDGVNACRAATEQGIVIGGGVSLVLCQKLKPSQDLSQEGILGYKAVMDALPCIFNNVVANAGYNPSEFIYLLDGTNALDINTGEMIKDPLDKGVCEPVKVILAGLKYATSVATEICTTEGAIYK